MYHIRNNAESAVRNLLRDVAKKLGTNTLSATEHLDDGTPACSPLYFSGIHSHLSTDLSPGRDKRGRWLRCIRL